jgi:hypothetical protein
MVVVRFLKKHYVGEFALELVFISKVGFHLTLQWIFPLILANATICSPLARPEDKNYMCLKK